MKRWFLLVFLLLCPGMGQAETLVWDRNSEPDVDHYRVFYWQSQSCLPCDAGYSTVWIVPQTAEGVAPSIGLQLPIPPATVAWGTLRVSAVDTSGNESAKSDAVLYYHFGP